MVFAADEVLRRHLLLGAVTTCLILSIALLSIRLFAQFRARARLVHHDYWSGLVITICLAMVMTGYTSKFLFQGKLSRTIPIIARFSIWSRCAREYRIPRRYHQLSQAFLCLTATVGCRQCRRQICNTEHPLPHLYSKSPTCGCCMCRFVRILFVSGQFPRPRVAVCADNTALQRHQQNLCRSGTIIPRRGYA